MWNWWQPEWHCYDARMKVRDSYELALRTQGFVADAAQLAAVEQLDKIYSALLAKPAGNGLLTGLLGKQNESLKGLYLWGGVGRGKTFLMDTFYTVLPFEEKRRFHFHRFMILMHEAMYRLENKANPLDEIARDLAKDCRVLCLDEMHIADEGDAVIVEGLLLALARQGVILVTTSNRAPDKLCDDPCLKQLFARAVEILQTNLTVMNVDGATDYRLRQLEQAEIWHSPLNGGSKALLEKAYHECNAVEHEKESRIIINERNIPVVKWADGVCWFDFRVICGPPRARIDYIEIARFFHTVLIQDIVLLNDDNNDTARRFTLLVDELYDHNVKLIVTAELPVGDLYQGARLVFEFQRTTSRLIEMQSHDYLARQHKP